MKLQSMSNKSTDYNVEEISANMIQDRHEVTHLKMYLKWKGKDWFKNTASIAYFSQVGFHCWMSSKVAEFSLYPHNSKQCQIPAQKQSPVWPNLSFKFPASDHLFRT